MNKKNEEKPKKLKSANQSDEQTKQKQKERKKTNTKQDKTSNWRQEKPKLLGGRLLDQRLIMRLQLLHLTQMLLSCLNLFIT